MDLRGDPGDLQTECGGVINVKSRTDLGRARTDACLQLLVHCEEQLRVVVLFSSLEVQLAHNIWRPIVIDAFFHRVSYGHG